MRVVNLIILVLSINKIAVGQELKHVTIKNDGLIESYFVYKTDKKIKEGFYFLKFNKDTLIKGNYKANKAVGLWEMRGNKNELELSYNYDSSIVKYYRFPSDEKINCDNINRPPICMIGFYNLKLITGAKSKYPKDFEPTESFTIKVTVGFTIDSKGVPINFQVVESSNKFNFDKQAYSDIKEEVENQKWIPALDKTNNPVPFDLKMSLIYKFQ